MLHIQPADWKFIIREMWTHELEWVRLIHPNRLSDELHLFLCGPFGSLMLSSNSRTSSGSSISVPSRIGSAMVYPYATLICLCIYLFLYFLKISNNNTNLLVKCIKKIFVDWRSSNERKDEGK